MAMNIKRLFGVFFTIIIILLTGMGVISILILNTQKDGYSNQDARVQVWAAASELRVSSENLTQYARAYVSTRDSAWLYKYYDALEKRSGKIPRENGRAGILKRVRTMAIKAPIPYKSHGAPPPDIRGSITAAMAFA